MSDTDKYEGLNKLIDRIINSEEIGVDDLFADTMDVKKGINEVITEVKRLRDTISKMKAEIEGTLKVEKKTYDDGGESDPIIQGWIEGLEYVLRQIEVLE